MIRVNSQIAILNNSLGYPGVPGIIYSGGLDDVVRDRSESLPSKFSVFVFARSKNGSCCEYSPKDNVHVIGAPVHTHKAGCEKEYLFKPSYLPVDDFIKEGLDFNFTVKNDMIPHVIKKYDIDTDSSISHMDDYFNGRLGIELQQQGMPFVFQVHMSVRRPTYAEWFMHNGNGDKRLIYEKEACERADKVIAVSEETRKSIIKAYEISPKKITVIENAVNTDNFMPLSETEVSSAKEYLKSFGIEKPYIISSGRFVLEKNHRRLIEAFDIFSEKHPEYNLVVAGFNGYTFGELLETRNRIKNSRKVILLNQQLDIKKFYQCAEFGVFPSEIEAFGLVSPQVQACGKPVIVSDERAGGIHRTIKEGVSGTHVNPFDINSIADGMERLHQNKEEMGKNARKFAVEEFSWKDRINEYEELYESLV